MICAISAHRNRLTHWERGLWNTQPLLLSSGPRRLNAARYLTLLGRLFQALTVMSGPPTASSPPGLRKAAGVLLEHTSFNPKAFYKQSPAAMYRILVYDISRPTPTHMHHHPICVCEAACLGYIPGSYVTQAAGSRG